MDDGQIVENPRCSIEKVGKNSKQREGPALFGKQGRLPVSEVVTQIHDGNRNEVVEAELSG